MPNKALVVDAYGDWHDVKLTTIDVPAPGPDEVLIDNRAASLNFADLLMIEGKYQYRPAVPFVPGRDAAGIVLDVGARVGDLKPGNRVAAHTRSGAFAQVLVVPAASCIGLPDGVSFEQGAAAVTIFATVVAALGMRARIVAGEWVLVTGAAGGVGSAAVQYARHLGGRVVALVSSAEKERAVRALGADVVLRSDLIGRDLRDGLRKTLADQGLEGVDVVLDMVGGDTFDAAIRCILPEGRLIVVGFASGRIPQVAANYLLLKDIAVIGSSLGRLLRAGSAELRNGIEASLAMLADGRMTVPIDATFALSEFQKAAALIADRKVIGKVVFELGG